LAGVGAWNLSARLDERRQGAAIFGASGSGPQAMVIPIGRLENALTAGKVLAYAQGFALLSAASKEYGWNLPMPRIAEIWRAGCIIRSAMLDDMAAALRDNPGTNLTFSGAFSQILRSTVGALREVVSRAALDGHCVPALASGLGYFDAMRQERSTANLLQAQRDFFGAHGFERIDGGSGHHGPWGSSATMTTPSPRFAAAVART